MFNNQTILQRKQVISDEISDVVIDWMTGDIRLYQSENEKIEVVQHGDDNLPEHKLFRYKVNHGRLVITDGRKKILNLGVNLEKTALELYLPNKQFHAISITSTGGSIMVGDLNVDSCKCKLTSGNAKLSGRMVELDLQVIGSKITGNHLDIQKLTLQSTSSAIKLEGEISELNINSIGRNIDVRSTKMFQRIKSVSTGANVKIAIPENDGFTLQYKKVAGHLKSDFPLTSSGDIYTYKDGKSLFNAEVRGGGFTLCRI
ncbi:DUF4097 family beta strand repeat-containing protein [Rubeoparvulum massiliense]|uniref:DUF4097 family beta strand repeat-containing protein n=1 Tax=Rubeoparvulum massiliense TaxID=1631346 RepID=UPI00065E5986|nr:DUF4097 family beta strand repeat-containing protein [Rubeoparvulum massiliense]